MRRISIGNWLGLSAVLFALAALALTRDAWSLNLVLAALGLWALCWLSDRHEEQAFVRAMARRNRQRARRQAA